MTPSHSLTANIQTLVAKMKSHDSGLCEHIRQLHDTATPTSTTALHPPPPHRSTKTPDVDSATAGLDPTVVADRIKEVKTVLEALQDEFAAMSFQHHELTNELKAMGGDAVSG